MIALPLLACLLAAEPGDDGRWQAGPYAFSDESGGFRIRAVSGSGSRGDPVILQQELYTASAVVMVIRLIGETPRYAYDERAGAGYLFIEIETLNASNLPWVEFEFELQEKRGVSSVYGDGLSFDQRNVGSDHVGSDAFKSHDRKFEPYDRLLFQSGTVDAGHSVTFRLLITDLTPQPVFYLVQDPRIPAS
ncbi:hypothetical protein JYP49_13905 [Nitratireductor aquimarinus]|uniref:hypothetical protein n=1 Tax=Nitratireductor TaxID=245876 RepID=UPI0019D40A70|nr:MULTISPECIES: hypothetical protein [Nitratireductor]MBN7777690.1 hypothetical protein [Nitratireductor pacificus]MBN7781684.1 hypothetical protein [Nitratireductor pacificus]MBN7790490.1 hypothetical protein [Nitratireductor aquimarinus]MBY6099900.1 hypothetical protein [Nitratireductor aquimarinus]MCA1262051.1 hypothetical protein [Nitratireductor aquimarinus]